jgi:hypothetical protein
VIEKFCPQNRLRLFCINSVVALVPLVAACSPPRSSATDPTEPEPECVGGSCYIGPDASTGEETGNVGADASPILPLAVDLFGVQKIYKDAVEACDLPACVRYAGLDGRDIHEDVENLPSYDGDGNHPLADVGDDVWGVATDWGGSGAMQARLELWSVDDDPWLTLEVTAFVKVLRNYGDAAIQPYVYGGSHSSQSAAVRCYGGAYKPKFRFNNSVTIQKELCHSEYTSSRGVVRNAWEFQEGAWYGVKSVAYPIENGVKIEMYLLQNDLGTARKPNLPPADQQNWVRLTQATDTGGWNIGSDYCESSCGTEDGTVFSDGNPADNQRSQSGKRHINANVAALRLDDVKAHIWGYSVRRINPKAPY